MTDRLTAAAKNLRKNSTDAENLLWSRLKARQIEGFKFRRQEPVGSYIADFVCFEKQIIIEVDGGQHGLKGSNDSKRDDWLRSQGFKVLRFWNNDALSDIEGVLEKIRIELLSSPSP